MPKKKRRPAPNREPCGLRAIETAANVGALKRVVDDALAIATRENDPDAIRQITEWRDKKVAKAKKPTLETA